MVVPAFSAAPVCFCSQLVWLVPWNCLNREGRRKVGRKIQLSYLNYLCTLTTRSLQATWPAPNQTLHLHQACTQPGQTLEQAKLAQSMHPTWQGLGWLAGKLVHIHRDRSPHAFPDHRSFDCPWIETGTAPNSLNSRPSPKQAHLSRSNSNEHGHGCGSGSGWCSQRCLVYLV